MSEMKKKLYRNLLIIFAVFILLFAILFIYQKANGRNISYQKIESKMISAARNYFEDKDLLPKNEGEIVSVDVSTLIENSLLSPFEKMTSDTNCSGKVDVQKNNDSYNYMVNLTCDKYHTETYKENITKNVVESGDGLYFINDEYVYRGENVNNYVSFASQEWRIVKITSDGYLKLVRTKKEEEKHLWDDRYNIDAKEDLGINIYEKSRLKDTLNEIYNDSERFSNENKKIISARNICVGERSSNNLSLNSEEECKKTLEGQFISLLDIHDSAYASLDNNCNGVNNDSCANYNYFSEFLSNSWTTVPVKGSTYKAYMASPTYLTEGKCNKETNLYIVVYINSNVKFDSGDGSKGNPFAF